jgi:beta-galactosidase
VDQNPDMLACDEHGNPRRFGSRRHYCFSNQAYRAECRRIVAEMAQRYGEHPGVVMWQTDNEYGCHDTVESYSKSAEQAFRVWLEDRYLNIETLNEAWGTVFWSQDYRSFDEVDLPGATVTEANPSHRLDFQRFSSDQVVSFNREQVDLIRRYSPGREITHNFMGAFTAFDHHKVGADLDVATWDSYPLGFLDQSPLPEDLKQRWLRQGHPDFQAFHHDLYRGCSPKWGVMEQQPGPVNWAPNNPAPLPGMVRLWNLEAIAHGADLLSWFRWRQAPFAQEHMHAGLLRVDGESAPAFAETEATAQDIKALKGETTRPAQIAIVFDYQGQWTHMIQPQGIELDLLRQGLEAYSALRTLGFDIDIVSPKADLSAYRLIILPGLPILSDALIAKLQANSAQIVTLPRTGSKTEDFHVPANLAPGRLQALIDLKVVRVESVRESVNETFSFDGLDLNVVRWRERVETQQEVKATYSNGDPMWVLSDNIHYLAGWPDIISLGVIFDQVSREAGLTPRACGMDLRLRTLGSVQFAFNYGPDPVSLDAIAPCDTDFLLGESELPPAGVAAWRA